MKTAQAVTALLCTFAIGTTASAQAETRRDLPGQPKPAGTRPFERSKWIVTLTPDKEAEKSGEKVVDDALTFEDGRMSSHVGMSHGFPPARFETGQAWARAEITAPDGRSRCVWRVECKGDRLEGNMVSTRGEGTIVNYKVEGKSAPALEGTRWAIKIEPDEDAKKGGETVKLDTIVFACGRFTRGANAGQGLSPAAYTLSKNGDKHMLSAETIDDAGDQTLWSAEFVGDTVKGSLRTTKKGGKELSCAFEGNQVLDPRDASSNAKAK